MLISFVSVCARSAKYARTLPWGAIRCASQYHRGDGKSVRHYRATETHKRKHIGTRQTGQTLSKLGGNGISAFFRVWLLPVPSHLFAIHPAPVAITDGNNNSQLVHAPAESWLCRHRGHRNEWLCAICMQFASFYDTRRPMSPMDAKRNRLFVSVIKKRWCSGSLLPCLVASDREMMRTHRSPNPGLNDAGKLIVSVTILNYFWALCASACNGTFLPPLFMFSDAKDHFHVY